MDTAELARSLKHAAALVIGLTVLGAIAGLVMPGLAGHTQPNPTLTGSATEALSILASNARVLAVPFALAVLQRPASRVGRTIGDAIVVVIVSISAAGVGIALGCWRGRLVPYLPHLPLEWAAMTAAVAAWLLVRDGGRHRQQLLALGTSSAVLLSAAAAVETWATPHRQQTARAAVEGSTHAPVGRLMHARMVPATAAGASTTASPSFGRLGLLTPAIARRTSTTDPREGSSR